MKEGFLAIDLTLAQLEAITGGYDWKRTGRAALGGAAAGATSGAVGGFMTAGPAGAGGGALVGGVTGAIGASVWDAGSQLHLW